MILQSRKRKKAIRVHHTDLLCSRTRTHDNEWPVNTALKRMGFGHKGYLPAAIYATDDFHHHQHTDKYATYTDWNLVIIVS